MSLPIWDPRKVLEIPQVYNLFQETVGAAEGRRKFIAEHIVPRKPARVLEVGCGPGINCMAFSDAIKYVGCDLDQNYITYAQQRFGHRAEFYCAPVGQLRKLGLQKFDVVMAVAVLHHLSDSEISTLADEVCDLLNLDGTFITGDPCSSATASALERFVTSCDRGRFVRYPEEYQRLLEKRFSRVAIDIRSGKLVFIPQTGVVISAQK